ncbi:hypothetical protein SH1V18_07050 [Vallitalea longa]|uniref:Trimethylamine corrinoid protein 2 n=1 Tax=Vallitalea longa TaxID=2936439 RepID=A0A9W5Y7G6_9FIRM|nr:trimethylamine corrinoid protein 2 [Vallitalea longa]GKX28225.1 hypothetical protein SH1V18_07050 [Vallitalea longa]
MIFKPDIDKVRERLYGFWEQEYTGRACISVVAPKYEGANISMFHNDRDMTNDKEALIDYWENPEVIYDNNIKRLEKTYLGGETLPIVYQNYGTSGHCNYFGTKPTYGNDTIWFDPVWDNLENKQNTYNEEVLNKHLAIAKYLTDYAGDKYFVGMPDSCGTIDAIAHLYGSSKVLMDMAMNPQALKDVIKVINKGWAISNEKFYQISKEVNCGGAHAWMHVLAPGRVAQMQCDLSVMISADMYEEFVLPELQQQIKWIDYPVYHFDGIEQTKHLKYILSLDKLKAIQWTHVAGQLSASHYIDTLKQIQNAGKSLIIMSPKSDVKPLLENLSAKGLYIHTEAENEQEAKDIVKYVENNSKE